MTRKPNIYLTKTEARLIHEEIPDVADIDIMYKRGDMSKIEKNMILKLYDKLDKILYK